jgi:uncharacterized membrane protein YqiK
VAERSKAQSEAQAAADIARAESVKAAEQVDTVREIERAERAKKIELVEASKEAERNLIGTTVAARAEKESADQKAQAIRTLAGANADQTRIAAQAAADGEKLKAEAAAARYEVDAEGQRKLNEAANMISAEQVAMQIRMALLNHLPAIIRESVKPMESIEGIRIVHVDGLTGSGNGNGHAVNGAVVDGNAQGNLAEQVVSSALRYRAQAPIIDSLMSELGLSGGDAAGLTRALAGVGKADEENAARKAKLDAMRAELDKKTK